MQPQLNHSDGSKVKPENFGFSIIDNNDLSRHQQLAEDSQAASFQQLLSEYMVKIQKRNAINTGFASCLISLVTAPMLTLATSMQLSMMDTRKTYNDFKTSSPIKGSPTFRGLNSGQGSGKLDSNSELGKASQFRSRGVSLPFKANSYANYME